MKRFLSVVLSVLLTLSCISVFADSADSAKTEAVLKSIKTRIGSTDQYDDFQSTVYDRGETIYRFMWSTDKDGEYSSLEVQTNTDGIILSYYAYDSSENHTYSSRAFNSLTSDDALKKTTALIEALNPMLKGQLVPIKRAETETIGADYFMFDIKRIENGYDVYDDTGFVRVNKSADKIRDFSISYSPLPNCTAPEKVISDEAAQKAFDEKLGMTLVYNKYYKDKSIIIKPVYIITGQENKYINAQTGEIEKIIEPSRDVYFDTGSSGGGAKNEAAAADNLKMRLSPAELSEIENISGLLSKEKLLSIMKNNKYIKLKSDESLTSYDVSKAYGTEDYIASLHFSDDKSETYANCRINAKTGEILSYNRHSYQYQPLSDKAAPKLNTEKAAALANEVAEYMAGEKFSEYTPDTETKSDSLTLTRMVNGIPVPDDKIHVYINPESGELENYSIEYTSSAFPDISSVITPEEASKKLFEKVSYAPVYMRTLSKEGLKKADKTTLVYMLDNTMPTTIDANSGVLLNYNGEEHYIFKLPEYSDLDGHYAKDAIMSLSKYGIILQGDSFNPNEKITQKDFIMLLLCTIDGLRLEQRDGSEDTIYRLAKNRGIITAEEAAPESAIKRKTAAQLMIRALGFEEYANLKDIYKCSFSDVTENIGAISILSGMKILSGDGKGKFNPDSEISRADSMMIMYKYLNRQPSF